MLRVYDIQKTIEQQECRLTAKLDCPKTGWQGISLWFSFPAAYADWISGAANPFLAAVLFLGMRLEEDIVIEGGVSEKLLWGVRTIMDIFRQWFPGYHRVRISASGINPPANHRPKYSGCFFSGGVDSFYTVLKNRDEPHPKFRITHLLFAQGLDISLQNTDYYAEVLDCIRQISTQLEMQLIEVKTNFRQLTDSLLDWHSIHGAALAAIGLCFEPLFEAVFISSEHTYQFLAPRGSHPLIDPLWSTETLSWIHDGAEANRVEKVRSQIAQSPLALKYLRVCWQNVSGQYNCGICEKCIRTKINLYLAGVLDQCAAFREKDIDSRRIESWTIREDHVVDFLQQNYNALVRQGGDVRLSKALKKAIHSYDRYHRKKRLKAMRRNLVLQARNFVASVTGIKKEHKRCQKSV